jgi:hypothetical protein
LPCAYTRQRRHVSPACTPGRGSGRAGGAFAVHAGGRAHGKALVHDTGHAHGKACTHGNADGSRQSANARQRIRAYDRAHNARQRLGRTTNPLPCNVGEAHDKETVAVNGTAMRPLPCKSSCFLVVSFPSLGASRSSPLPSESQIVKSTKLLRS